MAVPLICPICGDTFTLDKKGLVPDHVNRKSNFKCYVSHMPALVDEKRGVCKPGEIMYIPRQTVANVLNNIQAI